MRYEELIVALRKAGIPIKATLQSLFVLPPKKKPFQLVRWEGLDGKERLLCYMKQAPNIDAVGIPLELVGPEDVEAYIAVWKAEYGKKENPV